MILTPPCLLETEQPAAAPNSEYFDPKERSKERKKNVEMNRTDDKRSNAMAALKAKREGKQKREEEEAKRQAEREGNEDLDGGMWPSLPFAIQIADAILILVAYNLDYCISLFFGVAHMQMCRVASHRCD